MRYPNTFTKILGFVGVLVASHLFTIGLLWVIKYYIIWVRADHGWIVSVLAPSATVPLIMLIIFTAELPLMLSPSRRIAGILMGIYLLILRGILIIGLYYAAKLSEGEDRRDLAYRFMAEIVATLLILWRCTLAIVKGSDT